MKKQTLQKRVPVPEKIDNVDLVTPELIKLDNGMPVYVLNLGTQDVVKIDMVFNAGRWYTPEKLIAGITARMLREGTRHLSAADLADTIDYYGATIKTSATYDIGYVNLYCLNKHLDKLLPLMKEMLTHASFPQKELNTVLQNNREQHFIKQMKNDYVAQKLLSRSIFGFEHPYGFTPEPENYLMVNRDHLIEFYRKHYRSNNCRMIISGKVTDDVLNQVNQTLGAKDWRGDWDLHENKFPIINEKHFIHKIEIPGSHQSAIRIGKRLINKPHPDYHGVMILNAILGGYFGSRLMSNIREDKGYTYGIYSGLTSFRHNGYFYISTEVGKEVAQKAMKEIFKEINRLRNDKIPEDEMVMVRNYLMGTLLSSLDGPFNKAKTIKGLLIYDLSIDYLYNLIDTINHITRDELLELAQQYLDPEDMYQIVVG